MEPPVPSPRVRLVRTGRRLRRGLLRRRRPLAALCAGVAVAAGLLAVAPPRPTLVALPVATRDLPAGHRVAAADLEERRVRPDVPPQGLLTDPVGRVLAAPVRAGEPVTDVRVAGPARYTADPGRTTVPVRLPDPAVAGLLTAGDEVDLWATDPRGDTARLLVPSVRVVDVPPEPATGARSVDAPPGRLVLVAVPPSSVDAVTAAGVHAYLGVAWAD
jgi:Flp pilus assembly protein CpaB